MFQADLDHTINMCDYAGTHPSTVTHVQICINVTKIWCEILVEIRAYRYTALMANINFAMANYPSLSMKHRLQTEFATHGQINSIDTKAFVSFS